MILDSRESSSKSLEFKRISVKEVKMLPLCGPVELTHRYAGRNKDLIERYFSCSEVEILILMLKTATQSSGNILNNHVLECKR